MENFEIGFRVNRRFNHLVAANFTVEGAGAAVILGAMLLNHRIGLLAGLVLLLAGAAALFLDLGNPFKSWRSVFNLKASWISRGALFLGVLVVLSVLFIIAPVPASSGSQMVMKTAMGIFAVSIMLYTGFLVASMGAIPFWNSGLVPFIFMFNALATGMAVLSWIAFLTGAFKEAALLTNALPFLLIVILVASFWHMAAAKKKGGASKESVDMLNRGKWRVVFWIGGIFCGLILPLVLIFTGGKAAPLIVLPISAAARVAGDYCYRLAILKNGVYESVL